MANVTKYVAALGVAGAMLMAAPASFAQENLRQAYMPGVFPDCYYDISGTCGASGTYAAMRTVPINAYAANGLVAQPVAAAPAPRLWSRLRDGDWTAVQGANLQLDLCTTPSARTRAGGWCVTARHDVNVALRPWGTSVRYPVGSDVEILLPPRLCRAYPARESVPSE